jgi:hypothetical protein
MAGYIWLPINTDFLPANTQLGSLGLKSMAVQWNNGRLAKNKTTYTILNNPFESGPSKGIYRGIFAGCLGSLTAGDKLYVLSHGISSPGKTIASHLGATRSSGLDKYYTPAELAMLMNKEELHKDFVNISLYACDSGVGGVDSFACRLKEALKHIGYSHIRVTGYLGEVSTSYVHRYADSTQYTFTSYKCKGLTIPAKRLSGRASNNKLTFS